MAREVIASRVVFGTREADLEILMEKFVTIVRAGVVGDDRGEQLHQIFTQTVNIPMPDASFLNIYRVPTNE